MRRLLISCAVAATAFFVQVPRSEATQIIGSIGFGTRSVDLIGGTNLATATSLKINSYAGPNSLQAAAVGDYAGTGPGPVWAGITLGSSFAVPNLNLASLVGFTISNASYGTFTSVATQGAFTTQILGQSASFLDILMVGNFVPTGAFAAAGFTSSQAVVRYSFNQSGNAVSVGVTLSSDAPAPPTDVVPEPATYVAALLGVVPFLFARRRRAVRSV